MVVGALQISVLDGPQELSSDAGAAEARLGKGPPVPLHVASHSQQGASPDSPTCQEGIMGLGQLPSQPALPRAYSEGSDNGLSSMAATKEKEIKRGNAFERYHISQ